MGSKVSTKGFIFLPATYAIHHGQLAHPTSFPIRHCPDYERVNLFLAKGLWTWPASLAQGLQAGAEK